MPPDIVVHVKGRMRAGTHIDAEKRRLSYRYFDICLNETYSYNDMKYCISNIEYFETFTLPTFAT